MKLFLKLFLIFSIYPVSAYSFGIFSSEPLPTVEEVSLDRYVGKWYAITALPQIFTIGCVAQTADYEKLSDTEIGVINTCIKEDGSLTDIEGAAQATEEPGVLSLQFNTWWSQLFNIKADYNIIKLDKDYKYALIGGKNRRSLWFLSRTKTVSNKVYYEYISYAEELGFNTDKLKDSEF